MQFEIAKPDLVQALKFVSSTVAKSDEDLSGHYLFRQVPGSASAVEVLAYDGKISSAARLNCKYTPTEGGATAFTFEAKRMNIWLDASPDVALTFEYADNKVTAYSPMGKQKFDSLDPSKFPYWDSILEESTPKAKVSAVRLRTALQYVRPFLYADETKHPHLCQAQFRDGVLYATDTATAVAIQMSGFEGADFSVSSKAMGALLTFLTQCGDGEIEICEHDRMVIYRLGSTAIFGESRMHVQFPKLNLGLDLPNQHLWKINRLEFNKNLKFLLSAAPKDADTVTLADVAHSDVSVNMGMAVAAGGTATLPLACTSKATATSGAAALPDKGFRVKHANFLKVLAAQSADDVVMGVNSKGAGGWLRFEDEAGGDRYFAIVQWSL